MAKLNKTFSFLSLLVASILWVVWLESNGFLNAVHKKVISSLAMVVYLEDNASGNDIEILRKMFKEYKEISVKKFNNASEAYENLKNDPAISRQLELMEEDFRFPANFELLVDSFDIQKIRNIAKQIEFFKMVQHVDVRLELFNKAGALIKKIEKVKILSGWILLTLSMFFFYFSGYLYVLAHDDNLAVGIKFVAASMRRVLTPGARQQFVTGILAGLLGLAVCYLLVIFVEVRFYVNVFKFVLTVIVTGVLSSLSYLVNGFIRKRS